MTSSPFKHFFFTFYPIFFVKDFWYSIFLVFKLTFHWEIWSVLAVSHLIRSIFSVLFLIFGTSYTDWHLFYRFSPQWLCRTNVDLFDLMLSVLPWVLWESLEITAVSPVESTSVYHLSVLLPHTHMQWQCLDSWNWCCLSIALVVCLWASVLRSFLQGWSWDNGSLAFGEYD